MDDLNKGRWTYQYNQLGELTQQTNDNGHYSRMTYDGMGRMITRKDYYVGQGWESDTIWTYDNAPYTLGQLAHVRDLISGYIKLVSYDNLGRVSQTVTNAAIAGTVSKVTGGKFANGAATAAFAAVVEGIANINRSPRQGGGVTVDTSQVETLADKASVLDHLDTLRGDPSVDQSSLLKAQLDTLNVSTAFQASNTDLMIAVTQGRFRQNQAVVASVSAQAMATLATPGGLAASIGTHGVKKTLAICTIAGVTCGGVKDSILKINPPWRVARDIAESFERRNLARQIRLVERSNSISK